MNNTTVKASACNDPKKKKKKPYFKIARLYTTQNKEKGETQ